MYQFKYKMSDNQKLLSTLNFAALKHINQRRKNSEKSPYINHPISVANRISQCGKIDNVEILQAAILHDTVEDTNTSFEELEQLFGSSVTNIVREVTDDKKLPKIERKKLQIEHAKVASYGAKIVKLSDKLDNLSDLAKNPPVSWNSDEIIGYFCWCYLVVENLRGTNEYLERELDTLFVTHIPVNDKSQILEIVHKYYGLIENSD